jgi:GNAT superfamily N-acetyltransferase
MESRSDSGILAFRIEARRSMQLRVMTRQDIPGGVRLNTIVGWNQTEADWTRFLDASPDGCFVMDHDGKIVGTSATIPYERRFAWIGMVLVDPDYRNQGIGTTLLQRAVEYLDVTAIPTLKLDATPAGKPLYEKMGFVTEYEIDRWILKRSVTQNPATTISVLPSDLLKQVFEYDREVFGADRSALLGSLTNHAPSLVVVPSWFERQGYAFGRHGVFADHLGPWMARDDRTAESLLKEFLRRSTRETIIVDALKSTRATGELLREQGFHPARPLTRMYRGSNEFPGNQNFLCAILGPEFG